MAVANRVSSCWLCCVILTGLLVGVADCAIGFGSMIAFLRRPALGALQAPAAGVLASSAFRGGIATSWAATFALLYRGVPAIRAAVAGADRFILTSVIAGCYI